jgi:secreted trypsin-like serine protease
MILVQVSLAAVKSNDRIYTFCGGSLISSNAILTAAHCVTERSSTMYSVDIKIEQKSNEQFMNSFHHFSFVYLV